MTTYVPKTFPHQWLPEDLELKTWEQIEPWYQKLMDEPIDSPADLERWVVAAGELNAAVGEEGVERYIAMTCQTDDPEREAAYLAFVRDIEPKLKPIQNAIRSRYLDSPHRSELPRDRYFVFDRALENRRQSVSRGEHPPRDRAGRARAAVSEDDRRHDRHVSRPGAHAGPDGAVPRGDRPRRPPGGLGAVRQAAAGGSRGPRRPVRPDEGAPDRDRARGGLRQLRRVRVPQSRAVRLRHRRLDPVSRGRRAGRGPLDAADPGAAPRALGVETLRPWDLAVDPLGRPPLAAVRRRRAARGGDRDRSSARSTPSWATSSRSCAAGSCSTWPTARGRPPAATRRPSRTSGCRSSS